VTHYPLEKMQKLKVRTKCQTIYESSRRGGVGPREQPQGEELGWPASNPSHRVAGAATPGHMGGWHDHSRPWGGQRGHRSRLGVAPWATPWPRSMAAPATPWPGSGWHRHPSPPHGWLAGTSESLVPPWINEVISSFVRFSPIISWRGHPRPYGWLAWPLPGHEVASAATDLGCEWPRGLDLWPRRPPRGLPAALATRWPWSGWHRHPSPPHGQSAGTSVDK
jgi:hypothetical protein